MSRFCNKRFNSLSQQNKTADEKMDTFDVDISKEYAKTKRLSLDSKLGDLHGIRKSKLKSMLSECVEENSENAEMEKAAVKIQSIFRNYQTRKSVCLGSTSQTTMLNGGHESTSSAPIAQNETKKLDLIEGTT